MTIKYYLHILLFVSNFCSLNAQVVLKTDSVQYISKDKLEIHFSATNIKSDTIHIPYSKDSLIRFSQLSISKSKTGEVIHHIQDISLAYPLSLNDSIDLDLQRFKVCKWYLRTQCSILSPKQEKNYIVSLEGYPEIINKIDDGYYDLTLSFPRRFNDCKNILTGSYEFKNIKFFVIK